MAKTDQEKKAEQRKRDRLIGYREVTVRVAEEHVDAVREFAAQMPGPKSFEQRISDAADRARAELQDLYERAREYEGREIAPSELTRDPIALAALPAPGK